MLTFKTNELNRFYFFKRFLISILVVLLPIFYDFVFPTSFIKDSYYWVATGIIFMRVVDFISMDRLTEIYFDTDAKRIIFLYRTILSGGRKKSIPFDKARLEIYESESNWTWLFEPINLYFLNDKMEVFEMSKRKDGFSVDNIKLIIKTFEKFSPNTKYI